MRTGPAFSDKDLFPPIEPYAKEMLRLDARHEMAVEQSGNPVGAPVLFLHGGPGAGALPAHRQFFDPQHYRIIIYDQRGSGRSRPYADIRDNTTQHLVQDIETLRRHLGIERWLVFGGSWGSLLALSYAIQHPERCLGLVLRGIFLGRASEIDWFLHGIRAVFPEAWRTFTAFLPAAERNDLLASYHRRLTDPDPGVHNPAAAVWSGYESACSNLLPRPAASDASAPLALARIEAHYFVHSLFLDEGHILRNVGTVREIPATIVQGRYDMVCPMTTADELSRAWPEARLVVVPDAGHSAMEPGIRKALVRATEEFKRLGRAP
ncbi:MAG: prolyl aminopeptidase [Rhodospirillales bacterium]|nr:prolyl aminopeptidase [Rhodospirillales bacterium]